MLYDWWIVIYIFSSSPLAFFIHKKKKIITGMN